MAPIRHFLMATPTINGLRLSLINSIKYEAWDRIEQINSSHLEQNT